MSAHPAELTTLRALQAAILAAFAARYAGRVQTVAAYDPFAQDEDGADQPDQTRRALVTPALLLELSAIDPGPEDGTDREPFRLTFTAHCVLSFLTRDLQTELPEFAADVLACVRNNRWDLPRAVRVPESPSAQPGEFRPGLAGYDSWVVTWEQTAYLGPNAWAGGLAASEVWLGIAPLIGEQDGTAADYVRIVTPPDLEPSP